MADLLMEAVVLSFVFGGMLGAAIALHVRPAKVRNEAGAIAPDRNASLQPVRIRRRPPS